MENKAPQVAVVMGSRSDYPTMNEAVEVLTQFSVPCEERILSAHRTPERLRDYARNAERRGIRAVIAGAGGAAHLPGMLAAETLLPVFGVPIKSDALDGLDALLSIVQMPRGVPVATLSIGGAANAALFAIAVLAGNDAELKERLRHFRAEQTKKVPLTPTDNSSPLDAARLDAARFDATRLDATRLDAARFNGSSTPPDDDQIPVRA